MRSMSATWGNWQGQQGIARRQFNGFRLLDGTIDNSKCPHLHFIDDSGRTRCQTCGWELDKRTFYKTAYTTAETKGIPANCCVAVRFAGILGTSALYHVWRGAENARGLYPEYACMTENELRDFCL